MLLALSLTRNSLLSFAWAIKISRHEYGSRDETRESLPAKEGRCNYATAIVKDLDRAVK